MHHAQRIRPFRRCASLLIVVASLGAAHAQESGTTSATATAATKSQRYQQSVLTSRLDTLHAALNLSDDQQAAILPLLQQLQAELLTLSNSSLGKATSDARETFLSATMNQIRALLSSSQQAQLDGKHPDLRATLNGL